MLDFSEKMSRSASAMSRRIASSDRRAMSMWRSFASSVGVGRFGVELAAGHAFGGQPGHERFEPHPCGHEVPDGQTQEVEVQRR
jgi:hypothetical protein